MSNHENDHEELRLVMIMRLSDPWLKNLESVKKIAEHLVSLYNLLGLSDPSANIKWEAIEDDEGIPILTIYELVPDSGNKPAPIPPEKSLVPVKTGSEEPPEPPEPPKRSGLSEEEVVV